MPRYFPAASGEFWINYALRLLFLCEIMQTHAHGLNIRMRFCIGRPKLGLIFAVPLPGCLFEPILLVALSLWKSSQFLLPIAVTNLHTVFVTHRSLERIIEKLGLDIPFTVSSLTLWYLFSSRRRPDFKRSQPFSVF